MKKYARDWLLVCRNAFKFDFNLSYRLNDIIQKYSEGKPTLVFCCTRKGAQQAAKIVSDSCQYTKAEITSIFFSKKTRIPHFFFKKKEYSYKVFNII